MALATSLSGKRFSGLVSGLIRRLFLGEAQEVTHEYLASQLFPESVDEDTTAEQRAKVYADAVTLFRSYEAVLRQAAFEGWSGTDLGKHVGVGATEDSSDASGSGSALASSAAAAAGGGLASGLTPAQAEGRSSSCDVGLDEGKREKGEERRREETRHIR